MNYCQNCGDKINNENNKTCLNCGFDFFDMNNKEIRKKIKKRVHTKDSGSFGYTILGFLFPQIGLALYLIWRYTLPKNANMAGRGALFSVIVTMLFFIKIPILISFISVVMGG